MLIFTHDLTDTEFPTRTKTKLITGRVNTKADKCTLLMLHCLGHTDIKSDTNDERTDGRRDGQTDRQIDGRTERQSDGWTERRVDRRTERQMDEQMDGRSTKNKILF